MDQEKPIQVSFQIPPSALDSLARLAEQLRLLTEAANAPSVPDGRAVETEHMESGSFDADRFLALRQGVDTAPEAAGPAGPADTAIGDARAVSVLLSPVGDAEAVSADVQKDLKSAKRAGDMLDKSPEDAAPLDIPRGMQLTPSDELDSPFSPAEAEEDVPDAPEAWQTVEQHVPDAESTRAEAEERELALAAAQGEVSGGIEMPLGAGAVVQAQPEMPQSRWSGITEELVIPGPAPLTAEAVSLAFERDGRRYDNGFPLY